MIASFIFIVLLIPIVILSNPTTRLSQAQDSSLPVKISYGSCTSYSMEQLPLLSRITSSSPDYFIWLGDVIYLDDPVTDCESPTWIEDCGCSNTDFIRIPPHSCYSGDAEHARTMWEFFRDSPDVNAFVNYFQGIKTHESDYRMIGTYDDHDFGWNNGNRRMPEKQMFKEMFLDFLDVPNDSKRRRTLEGVQEHLKISDDIELWLLDERWYRDPMPCEVRRDWCLNTVLPNSAHNKHGWCDDYINNGGCCEADEKIYNGVCNNMSQDDELYFPACDHTHADFGKYNFLPNAANDGVVLGEAEDEPFCSMLGRNQREWLTTTLAESNAKIKLVASGSVLLAQPNWSGNEGHCSSDDWDCYRVEQKWLMNLLTSEGVAGSTGCQPIVLTGDYHFGDIKTACAGTDTLYGPELGIDSGSNERCIIQHMASGMSHTTATTYYDCDHPDFLKDHSGLRVEAGQDECSIITGPNWGEILYDGKKQLNIRSRGEDGDIITEIVLDVSDSCKRTGGITYHLGD
ncbi:hypothetical protein TL16_g11955 [Triparma laevis f. inornata]|uniref:PhoD-like phosphatase metallophosphatase domain-containing protein n=1 Tax=Triparma laevis f. inornata TaxID=1714386 RepID=A0A9W7ETG7_9STRA|nr:hypothetical protein TL16_g11955 [Triparma laevis f. inornata]